MAAIVDPPGTRLRRLMAPGSGTILPGATDAWVGLLCQQAGFAGVYATGAGIANTLLGEPDVGLTTQDEIVGQVGRIARRLRVPVLADGDTGFGGAGNVRRTVERLEASGAAGLHLEDQTFPKRCGHFDGKSVEAIQQMQVRVASACAARRSEEFVIFARTDARQPEGLDAAIRRAAAYLEAGADGLFVEALESREELQAVADAFPGVPLVANMVEGGRTPILPVQELAEMGYGLVLYANLALRLAGRAVADGLARLRADGLSTSLFDHMLTWDERQDLVGLAEYQAWEEELAAMWLHTNDKEGAE